MAHIIIFTLNCADIAQAISWQDAHLFPSFAATAINPRGTEQPHAHSVLWLSGVIELSLSLIVCHWGFLFLQLGVEIPVQWQHLPLSSLSGMGPPTTAFQGCW